MRDFKKMVETFNNKFEDKKLLKNIKGEMKNYLRIFIKVIKKNLIVQIYI